MPPQIVRSVLLVTLAWLASWPALAAPTPTPIPVVHSISIRNGNWMPLPVEDMRRAAGDAALSRLSDAGRLEIVSESGTADLGSLALEIALIGPAETAKLTIKLDIPGSPTLVSTASISVRALDHAGIFDAFEHVGTRAADRLVAKLDLLQDARLIDASRPSNRVDDPARKRTYDAAQAAKRAGRYAEARSSFEAVVASASDPADTLRQLAEDELRYGLPVFEAQQLVVSLGSLSLPGQQGTREKALARAENLYRQIQAENPSDVGRVQEAQRALDSVVVVRSALANAMRATVLARVNSLRIAMMEFSMMEGVCPDRDLMQTLVSRMNTRVVVGEISSEGEFGKRYRLEDSDSRTRIELRCSDAGVEIVESTPYSSHSPAAFR